MAFEVPNTQKRLEAIGPVADLPQSMNKAFDPASQFEPVPPPGPSDWLAVHQESGQSFQQFVQSRPNRPDATRHIIYLQPLGDFPPGKAPPEDLLRKYAAAWFAMDVRVLPGLGLSDAALTSRRNPTTQNRQLLTGDILALLKQKIPHDAFCLLGITMEDLYPAPSWNFVFGQASLRERVGVYSFARYDPAFYGAPRGGDYMQTLLRRSGKVLVHETGHMFGLAHCVYFRCGSALEPSGGVTHARCTSVPWTCSSARHRIRRGQACATLLQFYDKAGFDDGGLDAAKPGGFSAEAPPGG
jgi:archaemetzincin